MSEPSKDQKQSQADKFKEAARELGCDESEERFEEALRKIGGRKRGANKKEENRLRDD